MSGHTLTWEAGHLVRGIFNYVSGTDRPGRTKSFPKPQYPVSLWLRHSKGNVGCGFIPSD